MSPRERGKQALASLLFYYFSLDIQMKFRTTERHSAFPVDDKSNEIGQFIFFYSLFNTQQEFRLSKGIMFTS
jgi:hypothetical protein